MSVKPDYDVITVAPADAESDLLRIWRDNLPLAGAAEAKFEWLYRQAPRIPAAVFLLKADDDVVGTAGIGVRRFQVGDREVDTALLVDLAVSQEHRSLLPALRLVRAVREHVMAEMGFAYGFPNKLAIGVFKRARYKQLGAFARYARVLRHESYLHRIAEMPKVPQVFGRVLDLPLAPKLIGGVLDAGRVAVDAPKIAGAMARFKLQSAAEPDERIDQVWDGARGDYKVVAERSASFTRWRFAHIDATYYYLQDRDRAAQPRAYAVVSKEDTELVIWDMFGRVEHLGPLLDALIPRAVATGARTLTLRFLGDPRVVDTLTARGFREVEAERFVLYDAGAELASDRADLDEVSGWYLMDVDEDE